MSCKYRISSLKCVNGKILFSKEFRDVEFFWREFLVVWFFEIVFLFLLFEDGIIVKFFVLLVDIVGERVGDKF